MVYSSVMWIQQESPSSLTKILVRWQWPEKALHNVGATQNWNIWLHLTIILCDTFHGSLRKIWRRKKNMYYRYYYLIWTQTLIWRLWFFSVIQARSNFAPDLVLQPECGCSHLQVALSAKERSWYLAGIQEPLWDVFWKKIQLFLTVFFNNNMSILTYFYGFSKLQTFPVHCSCFYLPSVFLQIYTKTKKRKKNKHTVHHQMVHTALSFLHYWRKLSAS